MNPNRIFRRLVPVLLSAWVAFGARAGEVTTFYEVTLNERKLTVAGDLTTNTVLFGKPVEVTVRAADWKKFDDGNVSFLFPGAHGMSKQEQPEFTNWTLDGQDNVLLIYRLKGIDAAEFARGLTQDLSTKNVKATKVEDCEGSFGSAVVKGKRITVRFGDQSITQEVFGLHTAKKDYVIIIQNTGATPSEETKQVKAKLKETFAPAPVGR